MTPSSQAAPARPSRTTPWRVASNPPPPSRTRVTHGSAICERPRSSPPAARTPTDQRGGGGQHRAEAGQRGGGRRPAPRVPPHRRQPPRHRDAAPGARTAPTPGTRCRKLRVMRLLDRAEQVVAHHREVGVAGGAPLRRTPSRGPGPPRAACGRTPRPGRAPAAPSPGGRARASRITRVASRVARSPPVSRSTARSGATTTSAATRPTCRAADRPRRRHRQPRPPVDRRGGERRHQQPEPRAAHGEGRGRPPGAHVRQQRQADQPRRQHRRRPPGTTAPGPPARLSGATSTAATGRALTTTAPDSGPEPPDRHDQQHRQEQRADQRAEREHQPQLRPQRRPGAVVALHPQAAQAAVGEDRQARAPPPAPGRGRSPASRPAR